MTRSQYLWSGIALCLSFSACAPVPQTTGLRGWRQTELLYPRQTLGTVQTRPPQAPGAPAASPAPVTNTPTTTGTVTTTTSQPSASSGLNQFFPPKVGQVWRLTIENTGVWRLRFLEVDSRGTATGNASTANKVTRVSATTLANGVRRFIVAENPLTFACDFAPGSVKLENGDTMTGGRAFESRDGQLVPLDRACNAKITTDE